MSTAIRGSLVRGPAIVKMTPGAGATYAGPFYYYTQTDIKAVMGAVLNPVKSSPFATVNYMKGDTVIKIPLRIWGTYNYLQSLFPQSMVSGDGSSGTPFAIKPVIGSSLIGAAADTTLSLIGENGDVITFYNAIITKVPDLFLGVDQEFFEADIEVSCLIKNETLPGGTTDLYTIPANDTGTAWATAIAAFSTPSANYARLHFTGAWGGFTGFTNIIAEKGFRIAYSMELTPAKVDGYGTVDYVVKDFLIGARFIPIGGINPGGSPASYGTTIANIEAQSMNVSQALGSVVPSGLLGNLVLTATGGLPIFTIYNMFMKDYSYLWSTEELRNGELMLESVPKFTAGARTAIAAIEIT